MAVDGLVGSGNAIVLGRTDLVWVTSQSDPTNSWLTLPPGGLALSDIGTLAQILVGADANGLSDILSGQGMGFANTAAADPTAQLRSGVYLHALNCTEVNDAKNYTLDLQWEGTRWDLVPDLLSMDRPSVVLTFDSAEKTMAAAFHGQVILANEIALDVTVLRDPDQPIIVAAHLASGQQAPLKPLLAYLGLDALPGISDLVLSDMILMAQPGAKTLNINVGLANAWAPDWGNGNLALSDLRVHAVSYPGGSETQLSGQAQMFGQTCAVSVDHTGTDWIFTIAPELDPPIAIGEVLGHLADQFGLGALSDLLADFKTLSVSALFAEIGMTSRAMRFSIATTGGWAPDWCPDLSITDLTLDIASGGEVKGDTAVTATGKLHFGKTHTLAVTAQHQGRNSGITFNAMIEGVSKEKPLTLADMVFPASLGITGQSFPVDAHKLEISAFEVEFNTKQKSISVSIAGKLKTKVELDIEIHVDLSPKGEGSGFDTHFTGKLTLDANEAQNDPGLEFDLVFDAADGGKDFIASFQNPAGRRISLSSAVEALMGTGHVLPDMSFVVHDAVLIATKPEGAEHYDNILAMDIGLGVNLSELPLVSSALPAGYAVKLAFQPVYSTADLSADRVGALRNLLPSGSTVLGAGESGASASVSKSFNLGTELRLGDTAINLSLPLTGEPNPKGPPGKGYNLVKDTSEDAAPAPAADHIKWIKIQKKIGPLHLDRLGLGFDIETMKAKAVFDASLGAGGLTLSAMGLGATYDLKSKELGLTLDGIGLAYSGGPTEISGAFLKLGEGEYAGEAMIRTPAFTLSALGAYADKDAYKSLFVYAFLDYPLGGPPFCFIEGAAAGFGYNRRVRDIAIDEVHNFPFVTQAMGQSEPAGQPPLSPAETQTSMVDQMRQLDSWIHPKDGEHFIALGMKFNTFRIIDSFALAILSFGDDFRLDVLGLSTAVMPPPPPDATEEERKAEPHLAVIHMEMRARYEPKESFLGVEANLAAGSWAISPKCIMTGGFAFYSWYDGPHGGDFVTTLGGYHPDFKAPKHYPQAKRLEMKWTVSDAVEIKGNAYFALTPNALMAGGYLKASWHCGDLWASLELGADFLIQWKPFHYQAGISIDVSAGYGSLSGSIHASVDLTGPEFSGTAHFKFLFVSFSVDFGAHPDVPVPLDWPTFKSSFLPKADHDIVSTGLPNGVIRTMTLEDKSVMSIVNPKELSISTSSLVPIGQLVWDKSAVKTAREPDHAGTETSFGVSPMDQKEVAASTHSLKITRNGHPYEHKFAVTGKEKPYPGAMWGRTGKKTELGGKTVANILGQTHIVALKPVVAGQTTMIPRSNLQFDSKTVVLGPDPAIDIKTSAPKTEFADVAPSIWANTQAKAAVAEHITSAEATDARDTIAALMGHPKVHPHKLSAAAINDLIFAPSTISTQSQSR